VQFLHEPARGDDALAVVPDADREVIFTTR